MLNSKENKMFFGPVFSFLFLGTSSLPGCNRSLNLFPYTSLFRSWLMFCDATRNSVLFFGTIFEKISIFDPIFSADVCLILIPSTRLASSLVTTVFIQLYLYGSFYNRLYPISEEHTSELTSHS